MGASETEPSESKFEKGKWTSSKFRTLVLRHFETENNEFALRIVNDSEAAN